ncbi:hypothetical protein DFH08DRAFT_944691, partial [Mycena albidolilacea]
MSTQDSGQPSNSFWTPEREKRWRHAEAQRRYREKNLVETRTRAKLRMERLRNNFFCSKEATQIARERRRRWDADYREQVRRSKFCTKFGHRAFLDYYFPLYSTHGPHLPGLKFVWNDDEARARKSHKAKP